VAFDRAVGGRLIHVTAAANLPRIRAEGLGPAAELAAEAGLAPAAILLRAAPVALPGALLNHQRPLRMGRGRAFLDPPLTPADRAAGLDARVFLWPARRGSAFAASLADRRAVALAIDPVRRGPWRWVPAHDLDGFAANRMRRGLALRPDRVAEVSVTGHIPPGAHRVPGWMLTP
jgi:hypothetical protein